jgi:hypothetical protein
MKWKETRGLTWNDMNGVSWQDLENASWGPDHLPHELRAKFDRLTDWKQRLLVSLVVGGDLPADSITEELIDDFNESPKASVELIRSREERIGSKVALGINDGIIAKRALGGRERNATRQAAKKEALEQVYEAAKEVWNEKGPFKKKTELAQAVARRTGLNYNTIRTRYFRDRNIPECFKKI